MKKTILSAVIASVICGGAIASDGGVYTEEFTTTKNYTYNTDTVTVAAPRAEYVAVSQPAIQTVSARPCTRCGQPVRVKEYTEVIDHYQVYQPVTVYQPAGMVSERRVVAAPRRACSRCGY